MTKEKNFRATVFLVTNDGLGKAEQELQHKLAVSYFQLLLEAKLEPAAICFYADGVRMVVEGSPALEPLRQLEQRGVSLIACGTCLNFYGLADKLEVGIVGGMTDIIEAQRRAAKVITL